MKHRWLLAMVLLLAAGLVFADPDAPSNTDRTTQGSFQGPQDYYLEETEFSKLEDSSLFFQLDTPGNEGSNFEFGTGLWITDSLLASLYLRSQTSLNNDQTQSTDTVFTTGTMGEIVGKVDTTDTELNNQDTHDTTVNTMVGLNLGGMNVGVGLNGRLLQSSDQGTYSTGFGIQTTTVTTATSGGNVVSVDATEYDPAGYQNNKRIDPTVEGGVSLQMGDMLVMGGIALGAELRKASDYAAERTYQQNLGSAVAYPSFTPPAGAIFVDEEAPTAMEGVDNYFYETRNRLQDYTAITTALGGGIELPFTLAGQDGTLEVNGGYNFWLPLHRSTYIDVTTGEEMTINGQADMISYYDYYTNVAGVDVETNLEDYREQDLTELSEFWQVIGVNAGFSAEPVEGFAWELSYSPSVSLYKSTTTSNFTSTEVYTFEDGDGTDGNADGDDPDDFVETTTVTSQGVTEEYKQTQFEHEVSTGLQFFLTDRIRVNAGGTFTGQPFESMVNTTTTSGVETTVVETATNGAAAVQTDYSIDTTPNTDPEVTRDANTGPNVDYELGFTFFVNELLTLDARYTGAPYDADGNIFNVGTFSFEATVTLP